mmetsp:Transcript_14363/g.35814  ORF Transcript_14363/g.35814 Transcript_14363/m.35814 type:complete len:266 (+) Transcript_14363:4156-4953(+)
MREAERKVCFLLFAGELRARLCAVLLTVEGPAVVVVVGAVFTSTPESAFVSDDLASNDCFSRGTGSERPSSGSMFSSCSPMGGAPPPAASCRLSIELMLRFFDTDKCTASSRTVRLGSCTLIDPDGCRNRSTFRFGCCCVSELATRGLFVVAITLFALVAGPLPARIDDKNGFLRRDGRFPGVRRFGDAPRACLSLFFAGLNAALPAAVGVVELFWCFLLGLPFVGLNFFGLYFFGLNNFFGLIFFGEFAFFFSGGGLTAVAFIF